MTDNNSTPIQANKTKRQWRVGTFSMGTVLIVFGLVLILAQFKNFSGLQVVSTWWPVVMIILGVEILTAIYFSGEEKPALKYDFLSVFMVLLIGGVTLGTYALSSVGIIPALVESVSSRTVSVEVPEQRFALNEGIKNIVVKASDSSSNISSIFIKEADAKEVVAFAQATVSANSQAAAKALVPQKLVNSHTVGDTLFLDIGSVPSGNHFQQVPHVEHTIVLPRGRNVQVEANTGSTLKLSVNNLEKDWAITSGMVEATVAGTADVKVEAFARSLGGDVNWVPANPGQNPGVKKPDGSITFEENANGEFTEGKGKAAISFGQGSHKLKINADQVIVQGN